MRLALESRRLGFSRGTTEGTVRLLNQLPSTEDTSRLQGGQDTAVPCRPATARPHLYKSAFLPSSLSFILFLSLI